MRLTLLQRQAQNIDKQQGRLAESIGRNLKIDVKDLVKLMESDDFSIKRLRENCVRNESKLREANADSAFGQLLRFGVQHFMFDAYQSVNDFIYTDLVSVRTSTSRQEWYAPMYGVEIPRDVPVGGKFEDSKISGIDRELVNKKVGRMFSVERELVDDDQTGQIETRGSALGERMRYKEEADVLGTDVFTNTPLGRGITGQPGVSYTVAKGNRPATFAPLSQAGLEAADIAMHQALDPIGNRIMVKPSLLLVSPSDKFNAAKLLNSSLQPSVPGSPSQFYGQTVPGGLTGYVNTINPLQGLYTLKVSRFLPAGYWYLMEPKTSIIFQDRDPLELTMENRDSGVSFERDEYRWRVRRRYATDVIEYLYLFCGNGQ